LELANYQLIDIKASPHIAVCLMVVPEHLDWHADEEEYVEAKQQMFIWQNSDDVAIYYEKSKRSKEIAFGGRGQKIPYYHPPGAAVTNGSISIDGKQICRTDELKLLGSHNWQNACSALTAVWQVTKNIDAIRGVLTSFTGLEHRLEFVRELDGVKYYDDSFGTTPETAIVAIQAFKEPKILILGGSDKGANYDELSKTIKENEVRQVILIGNTTHPKYKASAPDIEKSLRSHGFEEIYSLVKPGGPTVQDILDQARNTAKNGDVILLSTACASFDMFKNYQDRGEQFKQAVLALA
jgi:UDP-N-acetylmuramoylalanine--D-glutamate ligase